MKTPRPVLLACGLYLFSLPLPGPWSFHGSPGSGLDIALAVLVRPLLGFVFGYFNPILLGVSVWLAVRLRWKGTAIYGFGNLLLMSAQLTALEITGSVPFAAQRDALWLAGLALRTSSIALLSNYSVLRFRKEEPQSLMTSGSLAVIAIVVIGYSAVIALAAVHFTRGFSGF